MQTLNIKCMTKNPYFTIRFSTFSLWIFILSIYIILSVGLPQDKFTANELYRKSAELGNASARDHLDYTEATEAVDEWIVQHACRMESEFSEIGRKMLIKEI